MLKSFQFLLSTRFPRQISGRIMHTPFETLPTWHGIFYFWWCSIFLLWTKSSLNFLYCCEMSCWSHSSDSFVSSGVFCIVLFSLRRSVTSRNGGHSCSRLFYGCEVPISLNLSIAQFFCIFYFCQCWIIFHFRSRIA